MRIDIEGRNGDPISSIEDWERLASTEGKWADGFSAKELGLLWLDGRGPSETVELLKGELPGLELERAVAEAQIRFDGYRGGVRNHDVLAYGSAEAGPVVVGIEGKVNEPLDATIAEKYEYADKRKAADENTNLDRRVDELLMAIAGRGRAEDSRLGGLRYQLFSALAGTLAAADDETAAAALVVHLIRSPTADRTKFDETRLAVREFEEVALGAASDGHVAGPFKLQHATTYCRADLPFWIAVLESDPAGA